MKEAGGCKDGLGWIERRRGRSHKKNSNVKETVFTGDTLTPTAA